MSLTIQFTVWCDAKEVGLPDCMTWQYVDGRNSTKATTAYLKLGWVNVVGGYSLCPSCFKKYVKKHEGKLP